MWHKENDIIKFWWCITTAHGLYIDDIFEAKGTPYHMNFVPKLSHQRLGS